jgi:hypothetical protein
MSEFSNKLKQLGDDEFDDITTSVNRERARRSQPAPEEMSEAQYMRWVDEELSKSQRLKAEAAKAKEQNDG